jgi:hypothetical protein
MHEPILEEEKLSMVLTYVKVKDRVELYKGSISQVGLAQVVDRKIWYPPHLGLNRTFVTCSSS